MRPTAASTLSFALILLAPGCGDDPTGPGPDAPEVLSISMVDGDGQAGAVGTELPRPLRVRVTHAGQPMAGVAVRWSPHLRPLSERTDADGIAAASWHLGTHAGSAHSAGAWLVGSNAPQVQFRATALPGPLDRFEWQIGGPDPASKLWLLGRSGELRISSRGLDAYGNGVPDVSLAFAVRPVSGTAGEPISVLSDADGNAGGDLAVTAEDAAGDFSVQASVPGLGTFTADFTVVHFLFSGDFFTGLLVVPQEATVKAGSVVRWGYEYQDLPWEEGGAQIGPVDGSVPGGVLKWGEVFEHRFETPGTHVWSGPTTVIVTP